MASAIVTTSPGWMPLPRRVSANWVASESSWPRVNSAPPLPTKMAGASGLPASTSAIVTGAAMARAGGVVARGGGSPRAGEMGSLLLGDEMARCRCRLGRGASAQRKK